MNDKKKYDKLFKKSSFFKLLFKDKEEKTTAETNIDGIHLTYNNIPRDLQTKIWVTEGFEKALAIVTLNKISLSKVVNTYTVGNFEKTSDKGLKNINNFYDPFSRFKDTWFDVCLIYDDKKSRKFMLKNPKGDPGALDNLKTDTPIQITSSDQTLIYVTTIQGLWFKNWLSQLCKIHFFESGKFTKDIVKDDSGLEWLQISRFFDTHAALTDISKTKMKEKDSIRLLVGLPTEEIYDYIDAWHPVTFKGVGCVRYFNFGDINNRNINSAISSICSRIGIVKFNRFKG